MLACPLTPPAKPRFVSLFACVVATNAAAAEAPTPPPFAVVVVVVRMQFNWKLLNSTTIGAAEMTLTFCVAFTVLILAKGAEAPLPLLTPYVVGGGGAVAIASIAVGNICCCCCWCCVVCVSACAIAAFCCCCCCVVGVACDVFVAWSVDDDCVACLLLRAAY